MWSVIFSNVDRSISNDLLCHISVNINTEITFFAEEGSVKRIRKTQLRKVKFWMSWFFSVAVLARKNQEPFLFWHKIFDTYHINVHLKLYPHWAKIIRIYIQHKISDNIQRKNMVIIRNRQWNNELDIMCDEMIIDDINDKIIYDMIMFKLCDSNKFVWILTERKCEFMVPIVYQSIFRLNYTQFTRVLYLFLKLHCIIHIWHNVHETIFWNYANIVQYIFFQNRFIDTQKTVTFRFLRKNKILGSKNLWLRHFWEL